MSAETAVPLFYGVLVLASTALWPMVWRSRIRLASVGVASVLAGPLFVACVMFPGVLAKWSRGLDLYHIDASFFLVVAYAIVVGALIALPANLIGSATMIRIGDHALWARRPMAWALVGGVAASTPFALSGFMTQGNAGLVFAFAITGGCSALICRRRVSWEKNKAGEQAGLCPNRPRPLSARHDS